MAYYIGDTLFTELDRVVNDYMKTYCDEGGYPSDVTTLLEIWIQNKVEKINEEWLQSGKSKLSIANEPGAAKVITADELGMDLYLLYLLSMPYKLYLKTQHWIDFRTKAKSYYKSECQLCGNTSNLHLHHKNYNCLGRETYDDVILLCNKCHAKQHNKPVEGERICRELTPA